MTMSKLDVFFPNARMTELGKIKVGGLGEKRATKSGGTFRMPVKHDHFTITTMHRNPDGDLIADADLMGQLVTEYGDADKQLRQLPISVLSNEIDDVLQTAYVWYGGKTVGARSDGHTVTWLNSPRDGARLKEPLVEPWRPEMLDLANSKGQKLFKMHSTFNCVIRVPQARWGGVYRFRTTSVISAGQLYQGLIGIASLTGGVLIGMPLFLVVRPQQVAPDGKATTVYVVHVELRGPDMLALQRQALDLARFQLENREQIREIQTAYKKLMLPPGMESTQEAADINAEFQPETTGDLLEEAAPPPPDPFWQEAIHGQQPREPGSDDGEIPDSLIPEWNDDKPGA